MWSVCNQGKSFAGAVIDLIFFCYFGATSRMEMSWLKEKGNFKFVAKLMEKRYLSEPNPCMTYNFLRVHFEAQEVFKVVKNWFSRSLMNKLNFLGENIWELFTWNMKFLCLIKNFCNLSCQEKLFMNILMVFQLIFVKFN
jgi:hypothetical protein